MSTAKEVTWTIILGIEIEDLSLLTVSTCNQMTTIRELKLSALLHWEVSAEDQRLGKDVHLRNLIVERHNQVETRGMHGDCKTLLGELLNNLLLPGHVVPDPDCFIFRTGNNQLLSNTNIETSDGICVESTVYELNLDRWLSLIVKGKLRAQDLVVLSDVVNVILRVR